jgi:hypothetical protein
MKHFFYIIAIMSLLATLNSCTADEIETDKPKVVAETETETKTETEIDPRIPTGGTIPPKR